MKRIILTIAILASSISLLAQDKYSFSAKVGSGILMTSSHITPFNIEAMAHYNLTSHWAFGVGTGYGLYDNISTIPLYANVKYTINPKAKYNMFADCSAGHSFALGSNKNEPLQLLFKRICWTTESSFHIGKIRFEILGYPIV